MQLCLMLGAGADERLKEVASKIVEPLKEFSPEDGCLANWLADLPSKRHFGVGLLRDKKDVAEILEAFAIYFEGSRDLHRARDYLDATSEWYKKSKDVTQSTVMSVGNAECWVKEAIARQAGNNPSNMAAANFDESAIHKCRPIPRALHFPLLSPLLRVSPSLTLGFEK